MKKIGIAGTAVVAVAVTISILIAMRGVSKHEEYKKTPEYSLLQLRQAVENHDTVSFEKYVDVESVVGHIVDPLLEVDKFKGQSDSELVALGELVYRKLSYPSKSELTITTHYKLVDYVKTGEYKPKNDETDTFAPVLVLENIWQEVSGGTVAGGDGKSIENEGDRARAGYNIRFEEYDTTLVLDFILESRKEYWQVTGIENFPEFLQRLVVLRNKKVLEAMNQTLTLEDVEKSTTDGRWGIGTKVIFETKVRNHGEKEIERYALKVICNTKDGKELDSFVITNRGSIPPGNEGEGFWYRDVNVHTGQGKMLYETDRSDMRITTSVESIVFADDSTLEIWGKQEEMG
jgi:hypothetical protein